MTKSSEIEKKPARRGRPPGSKNKPKVKDVESVSTKSIKSAKTKSTKVAKSTKSTKVAKATKVKKKTGPKGPRDESRRSQQRVAALAMGMESRSRRIESSALKARLVELDCYNSPNFTQDMKKDADLFESYEKGDEHGWVLTEFGVTVAKAVAKDGVSEIRRLRNEQRNPGSTKPKASKALKDIKLAKTGKPARFSRKGAPIGRPPKMTKTFDAELDGNAANDSDDDSDDSSADDAAADKAIEAIVKNTPLPVSEGTVTLPDPEPVAPAAPAPPAATTAPASSPSP